MEEPVRVVLKSYERDCERDLCYQWAAFGIKSIYKQQVNLFKISNNFAKVPLNHFHQEEHKSNCQAHFNRRVQHSVVCSTAVYTVTYIPYNSSSVLYNEIANVMPSKHSYVFYILIDYSIQMAEPVK